MKYKSRLKPEFSIMMTPMIDVVFLLLIFFMVTYTQADRTAQTVSLPRSSTSAPVDVNKILVVSLKKDGSVYVKDKKLSKQEFTREVKKYIQDTGLKQIILRGDELVPYGSLMEIMDIAKESGIEKISLSTRSTQRRDS